MTTATTLTRRRSPARTTIMSLVLAASFMAAVPAPSAQAAISQKAPVASSQAALESDVMSPEQLRDVKRNLQASSLARSTVVAEGVQTLVYTLPTGGQLVIDEKQASKPSAVTRKVSAGGCGWGRLCVYLTPTEQRMIYAGAGAGIAASICLVTGPAGCVAASVVVAMAFSFINDKGICGYRLRVQILPWVGGARCV